MAIVFLFTIGVFAKHIFPLFEGGVRAG